MGHEIEVDLVSPFKLNGLAREHKVNGSRLCARGDGGWLWVDVDLDVVGDVVDGGGVGCDEVGLRDNERRDNTLKENIRVDEWDSAKSGVGCVLPEIVVDDKQLQCSVCNRHFE